MRRIALAVAGVLVMAFLADQTMQRSRIDDFVKLMDRDPVAAAGQLAASADRDCRRGTADAEIFSLARALFAVETLARSRSEAIAERAITRTFLAFGGTGPDLSVGEGQVRISTLRKALAAIPASERPAGGDFHDAVRALFERCRALDLAVLIIRHHVNVRPAGDALLPRGEILRVARFWNGQTQPQSREAFIAARRYQELVYHTFMALRFRSSLKVRRSEHSS
ncbi:MAG: hypothetical protein ACFCUR_00155 [Rhodomicrobiaceae bacterium]